jgi:hypothetical protein
VARLLYQHVTAVSNTAAHKCFIGVYRQPLIILLASFSFALFALGEFCN